MKTTITLELVKRLYENVSQELKEAIELEVPSVKVKTGVWYKSNNSNLLFVLNSFAEKGKIYIDGYGFDYKGVWFNTEEEEIIEIDSDFSEATPKQVETAIKNQCIRLGIWDNPNVICAWFNRKNKSRSLTCFDLKSNELWGKYGCLFNNGKFATPITEPTEKKLLIEKALKEIAKQRLVLDTLESAIKAS